MHLVHTAVWNLNPSVLLYVINISPSLICIFDFKLLGWSVMHASNEQTTASTLRRWFCYGLTSRTDPSVLNFLHFTIHFICVCVCFIHISASAQSFAYLLNRVRNVVSLFLCSFMWRTEKETGESNHRFPFLKISYNCIEWNKIKISIKTPSSMVFEERVFNNHTTCYTRVYFIMLKLQRSSKICFWIYPFSLDFQLLYSIAVYLSSKWPKQF